jgi:hypothetical protein
MAGAEPAARPPVSGSAAPDRRRREADSYRVQLSADHQTGPGSLQGVTGSLNAMGRLMSCGSITI